MRGNGEICAKVLTEKRPVISHLSVDEGVREDFSAPMADAEFECLMAISGEAFDIHGYLTDFIKGEKITGKDYLWLLDRACSLMDKVRSLQDLINSRK